MRKIRGKVDKPKLTTDSTMIILFILWWCLFKIKTKYHCWICCQFWFIHFPIYFSHIYIYIYVCVCVYISDVLLWTPSHGRASVERPARTYLQQLCADTGCSLEEKIEKIGVGESGNSVLEPRHDDDDNICRYRYEYKVELATVVEGDPKAPFTIATTPRCRWGHYSFPWIAPLYSWYVLYIEC